MRLAVLLALHNHPEQANCFIEQMDNNDNVEIFIHIDGRSLDIENKLLKSKHIHIMPIHFNVSWGDFTQVQYVVELLKFASEFGEFDYYSLHTGNDIIVKPIEQLFQFLEKDHKYAYLDCHALPWKEWQYGGGLGRLALTWPDAFRKRLKPHSAQRYLRSLYGKAYGAGILRGKKLPNIQFYGRSAFFTIREDCAKNILRYLDNNQWFLKLFEKALCGDEIFIDTLANLTVGENTIENSNNLRYIDFGSIDKRNVGAPKTLTEGDIENIDKSNAFFARKVDLSVDREIIDHYKEYCLHGEHTTQVKKPIRVLNLFTIMDRGGAETMVMNYYRNINREKVQFDFIVHREKKGAYDDEIEKMGGKIYYFPRITNIVKYNLQLDNFFKTHREYKIVHSHMSELGLNAVFSAKKNRVPIRINHAHSKPRYIDGKLVIKNIMKRIMKPLCTHLFSCSKEAAEWLYGENENKVFYLKNAIDSGQFSFCIEKQKAIREQLGISENSIVYGHIGRFTKEKNHRFIVEIFSEIHKRNPEVILLFVGDGPLKEELENDVKSSNLKDSIYFLGVRKDIPDLLQSMDVMIFPSLYEGLPVTLVEAQCSGLHCLISDQISEEAVLIPELITKMSLETTAAEWAKMAESLSTYERRSFRREIINLGFDIKENARWLEQFYISEAEKYE